MPKSEHLRLGIDTQRHHSDRVWPRRLSNGPIFAFPCCISNLSSSEKELFVQRYAKSVGSNMNHWQYSMKLIYTNATIIYNAAVEALTSLDKLNKSLSSEFLVSLAWCFWIFLSLVLLLAWAAASGFVSLSHGYVPRASAFNCNVHPHAWESEEMIEIAPGLDAVKATKINGWSAGSNANPLSSQTGQWFQYREECPARNTTMLYSFGEKKGLLIKSWRCSLKVFPK